MNTQDREPEAGPSGDSSNQRSVNARSISFVAPPFWKANVSIWFSQCEAQFRIKNIDSDQDRFDCIVSSIDSGILSQVSDLVVSPPAQNKYETVKARIIDAFSDSEDRKLQRLLKETTLGDRRPSQLLREMKDLANNKVSDNVLKSLWLQQLPQNTRAILSVSSNANLETLVPLADKIMEVLDTKPECAPINVENASPSQPSVNPSHDDLASKIEALTRRFDSLEYRKPRYPRSRSKPPARDTKFSDTWQCQYHFRYGDKARHCEPACCFFKQHKPAENE